MIESRPIHLVSSLSSGNTERGDNYSIKCAKKLKKGASTGEYFTPLRGQVRETQREREGWVLSLSLIVM